MNKPYSSWHNGTILYQIYPRSFYDAKGTGIGNLEGILHKLDYLGGSDDSLGINAIWISPMYPSPMADFGYDVSDYTNVDPIFGSLSDMQRIIDEAHARNIKVMLDFVLNHSSDEHPWFIESKSSKDNPKRDWYTWKDPGPDGSLPNNWRSIFGGPAWTFSEETGQYYLHTFLSKQPDLNWENPEVREALKNVMRFWLDKGVDGFRLDAVNWLSKDTEFRDDVLKTGSLQSHDPENYGSYDHIHSREYDKLFEYLSEVASVLSEYEDRFMINEAHPEKHMSVLDGYMDYYKSVDPRVSAPFNLQSIHMPWDAEKFREYIDAYQQKMEEHFVPIYTLGNHDESRVATRFGSDAARVAAMLLLTLPGIASMYYGDEIGMHDVPVPLELAHDPVAKLGFGRDPERTPMQWDVSTNAGFTTAKPWLPIADDYAQINVAKQSHDPTSILTLNKRLIALRNQSDILRIGSYISIDTEKDVFGYIREADGERMLVLLNFADTPHHVHAKMITGTILLSTTLEDRNEMLNGTVELAPNEGIIIALT